MFLLPGIKFEITELITPCTRMFIKIGSTGFISVARNSIIELRENPVAPVTYWTFITRVGKTGKDRITLSPIKIFHNNEVGFHNSETGEVDLAEVAKFNDRFGNIPKNVVAVKTYDVIDLNDLKPNEFVAYLLSCYYYIANILKICSLNKRRELEEVVDVDEYNRVIAVISREGLRTLNRHSFRPIWFFSLIQTLCDRLHDITADLIFKYDYNNDANASLNREVEIYTLKRCLANYTAAIKKYISMTEMVDGRVDFKQNKVLRGL